MRIILLMTLGLLLAACTANAPTTIQYSEIPETGDAVHGEELFNTSVNLAPACVGCHIPNNPASPSLDGFGEVAGTRVEGQSAREYTFYSIVEPDRYTVEGYGVGIMYNKYDENLSAQDIADLIAYLLSR
jgi:mono/diheme cytochrome c family protein